mgnify:CR=1 FL=1
MKFRQMVALMLVAAMGWGGAAAGAEESVKVGVLAPLTGFAAADGAACVGRVGAAVALVRGTPVTVKRAAPVVLAQMACDATGCPAQASRPPPSSAQALHRPSPRTPARGHADEPV